jgi:hypothetical protein
MSDSDVDVPSDAALSRALRDATLAILKTDDDVTVNNVRLRAQEKLGLSNGFFQSDVWKKKSKQLIHEVVVRHILQVCTSSR